MTRLVLARLFPAGSKLLRTGGSYGRESGWLEAKRVASSPVFRRYLHRSLATGEAPSARVDAAIEALADAGKFETLVAAAPDAELDDLLRRARSRIAEQPAPDVLGCSLVVLRAASRMHRGPGSLELDPSGLALWFVEELLARLDNTNRVSVACRLVDDAPTLSLRRRLLFRLRIPPDGPSDEPRLDILGADLFESLRSRLAADTRDADGRALAMEDSPLWLVQLVGEASGPAAALEVVRSPDLLRAILERSGTSLRPVTDGRISLYLKPLIDAAGEPVLDLLRQLPKSGELPEQLAEELRDALERPP